MEKWKIQLTIANNFTSYIDNGEQRLMHSKIDNIEIMMNDKADEIIEELFDSLKNSLPSIMFMYCIRNAIK